MIKLSGAILDAEGYIVFEFTTGFHPTQNEADGQAREILRAYRAYTGNSGLTYAINGEESDHE